MTRRIAKRVNLTITEIKKLVWSKTESTYYTDINLPGLRFVISPKGRMTFQIYKKINGKAEKSLVGHYPEISPDTARKIAKTIMSELELGIDRRKEKVKKRNEPIYSEIWKEYRKFLVDNANKKPKTAEKNISQYDSLYNCYEKFHKLQLSEITTEKLVKFHRYYSIDKGKKANANNILRQIRACFNYAQVDYNPAISRKIKYNPKVKRKKYLRANDFQAFVNATLQDESRDYRDVFLLCLFTSARIGTIMSMEWKDVKFEYGIWEPVTKSSDDEQDTMPIGLNDRALKILITRDKYNTDKSKWVFPATSKSGHLSQPQKAFKRILDSAGLEGYTPHDLRRTAISLFAQASATDQELLTLSGNKTLDTKDVYAQRDVEIVNKQYGVVLDRMLKNIEMI